MGVAALVLLTVHRLPAGLSQRVDVGPQGRLLLRNPDVESEGGVIRRGDVALYGLAYEVRGEHADALVSATAGLADRLGEEVDRDRSLAVAGSDRVMLDGSGPAVIVYALRRLPTMSLAAFQDYWISVHADYGRRALHGQGYRQLHADPALSAEVAKSAGVADHDLDGAVVSASTSWDEVRRRRDQPERRAAGAAALADEDNFIDHTRSFMMRYSAAGD